MNTHLDALLIEDNHSDAQLVEAIVNASELARPRLHHATRFEQAVAMIQAKTYDVVLLELNLPDGQGLILISQLQKLAPKIPIVVLTGVQDQTTATAALQEGAQDYLVKSDTFSANRLQQLGYVDVGNLLVQRILYAVQRAKLLQKIESNQERYVLAAQGASDGIWDWDLIHHQVYYSPRWLAFLGLCNHNISNSPDEWISRIHPLDRDHFQKALQDYLTHRQTKLRCEYRLRHAEGHYIWVLTKGTALWTKSGKAYRIAGSHTDITPRKALEHSSQQNKELAQTTLHSLGLAIISILAALYLAEGRYEEAEPLLQGTLEMRRRLIGNDHPDVAVNLYNLAALYDNQSRYREAQSLFEEALALYKRILGPEHPQTKTVRMKVLLIVKMNQALGL